MAMRSLLADTSRKRQGAQVNIKVHIHCRTIAFTICLFTLLPINGGGYEAHSARFFLPPDKASSSINSQEVPSSPPLSYNYMAKCLGCNKPRVEISHSFLRVEMPVAEGRRLV